MATAARIARNPRVPRLPRLPRGNKPAPLERPDPNHPLTLAELRERVRGAGRQVLQSRRWHSPQVGDAELERAARRVRRIADFARASVERLLAAYERALGQREDDERKPARPRSLPDALRDELAALQELSEEDARREYEAIAAQITRDLGRSNTRQVSRMLEEAFGLPVAATVDDVQAVAVAANRDLVQRMRLLPGQHVDQVERELREAWEGGRSVREVAGILEQRVEVTQGHAERMARDHMTRLNAQLTQAQMTALGIDRYRWLTMQDSRVRPEHAAREGQVFRWSNPPPGGHPGEDYGCRCFAEPALDDLV